MTTRNAYIAAAVLCLAAFIVLPYTARPAIKSSAPSAIVVDAQKLKAGPGAPLLTLMIMAYIGLLAAGVINLTVCAAGIIKGKQFIPSRAPAAPFPLNEERAARLLFLCIGTVLLITLAAGVLLPSKLYREIHGIGLILNLCIEISVILLILNGLPARWLGFHIAKDDLRTLFKIYTTMLPALLLAVALNSIAIKTLGIKPALNAAIPLMLSLKNSPLIILLTAIVVTAGPVAEELFFRGFIYKLMRTRYSFFAAAVFSSVCFAVPHGQPQLVLPIAVLGFALCYAYEKTQNILAPILFHAAHNFMTLALLTLLKNYISLA